MNICSLVRCWFDDTNYKIQQEKKVSCSLVGCWSTIGCCQNKRAEQKMQNTKIPKYRNACSFVGCRSSMGCRDHQTAKYKVQITKISEYLLVGWLFVYNRRLSSLKYKIQKYKNIRIPGRCLVIGLQ